MPGGLSLLLGHVLLVLIPGLVSEKMKTPIGAPTPTVPPDHLRVSTQKAHVVLTVGLNISRPSPEVTVILSKNSRQSVVFPGCSPLAQDLRSPLCSWRLLGFGNLVFTRTR